MKKKYGLIGYPLKHSFSQRFFTEKFEREEIEAEYCNFEIPDISVFSNIIANNPNLNGLNVTIPYKEQVIQFLNQIDKDAADIGAINVIKITKNEGNLTLKGYNSDVIGFQKSISPLLKEHHKKALVLGTGGASKAVVQGLKNLGIETQYVSRRKQNNTIAYDELNEQIITEHTIIVNASPLGTFPDIDTCPDIPYQYLTSLHLLYDLVYNPSPTKFLKLGAEKGTQIKDGYEMLELQALAAWDIWNS
ncbi:shikimate dehydrogenase [Dysgonomonas sp. 216]|uniref:shikimate dehydrogenase family protein n=1 Tax=Dysgonomonas sp. 216 TaxID=2302934 RepID=UPI0013D3BAE7|nr:shikimate dehydrogenase [Dysgonomonas sp. 216]NDW18354.1 shikimate dehydrogenase [Dysgonomonas sp. 216]NDW18722.1 shikimate dehydrogenase [Dysgonomonas sp. 216]